MGFVEPAREGDSNSSARAAMTAGETSSGNENKFKVFGTLVVAARRLQGILVQQGSFIQADGFSSPSTSMEAFADINWAEHFVLGFAESLNPKLDYSSIRTPQKVWNGSLRLWERCMKLRAC